MGDKKIKIGIFTWIGIENYGTAFQVFALYTYLVKMYDVSLVKYFNLRKIGSIPYTIKTLTKIVFYLPLSILRFVKSGNIIKGIKISSVYKKMKILSINFQNQVCLIDDLDIFITGSDQIWNPYYLDDFYLLVSMDDKKKMSYSSSIGVSEIPTKYEKLYIEALLKFKSIAVREKSAETLLKNLLKREDVCTVVDPVFLLSKEEWINFYTKKPRRGCPNNEKYIFCYLIGDRDIYTSYLDIISKKTGIQNIIYIPSVENKKIVLNGKCIRTAGLEEFLFFMANSELVVTDSFHATALSLILEKQFIEFIRFENNDSMSQNSRIYDLLGKYGLEKRIFDGESIPTDEIDYLKVKNKIKVDIEFSKNYLKDAIRDIKNANM